MNKITPRSLKYFAIISLFALSACDKGGDGFSLLADSATFKQNVAYVQRPIDILWVIDNSGSMATSQTNLANNFASFISRFSQLGYDFRMGVIGTNAYFGYHLNDNTRSRLRDGVGSTRSGVYVMDKNTPNLNQVFATNIRLGTTGSGDERAFSSFEHALGNPLNNDFRRPGAFLAIIIVSDEDDFSHYDWQNGMTSFFQTEDYNQTFPLSRFTSYLDNLTGSTVGGVKNYSVSAITIMDNNCLAQLNTDINGRKIGQRYMQLADLTGGTKGSLCSDFGNTLQTVSDRAIELSSEFKLDREPFVESIVVRVNGVDIPQSETDGWSYNATNWSITFKGSSVPAAGADVKIYFDPKTVKF